MSKMPLDVVIRVLRKLRQGRDDVMDRVERKRSLSPSAKAMWLAELRMEADALDVALDVLRTTTKQ